MADKDLRIQITTAADTSGADAAAAAMGKVESATKAADGGGVDISELTARLDVLRERTKAIQENAGATEELGEKANTAAPKLDKMIGMGRAMAAAQAARALGEVGNAIKGMGEQFKEIDPVISRTLGDTAKEIGTVSSIISAAAMGASMAGPYGAAAGAAAAGIAAVANEWINLKKVQATGAKEIAESTEALSKANSAFNDHARGDSLQKLYTTEKTALEELIQTLAAANKMSESKGRADKAKRDLEDFKEIEGGATPEEVRIKRIKDDAAAEKTKVDEEYRQEQAKLSDADKASTTADQRLAAAKREGLPEKEISKYQKQADAADTAYKEADKARYLAGQTGLDRKEEIDALAALDIAEQEAALRKRWAKGNQSVEPYGQAAQDAADALRNQASAAKRAAADEESARGGRLGLAGESMGMAEEARRRGSPIGGVYELRQRADALMKNPSAKNEEALHDLVEKMLNWADRESQNNDGKFSALHAKFNQLERREKLR
jgi:hypothetical protein